MKSKWLPICCAGALTLALDLPAEETFARRGVNDPAGHDAGDDRGRGHGADDASRLAYGAASNIEQLNLHTNGPVDLSDLPVVP